ASDAEQRFIAYCDPSIPRRVLAKEYHAGCKSVVILIGPEGDFDPQEIKDVLDTGYIPVTLGDNRLRTETAALVACDTFHIINQLNS
ncbi:MAG: 16S rRNA (uracil(1498)-N(3))-methyltransferase, partial [Muribaculum sp.]|nr:16S rRNA (uracil(1498)-N(3))-methyltransferase [Muribaculum sp.]